MSHVKTTTSIGTDNRIKGVYCDVCRGICLPKIIYDESLLILSQIFPSTAATIRLINIKT